MTTAPHRSLTDERLVALHRAGDKRAFTAIHERYRAALLAFARRMLHGSGQDPDDVIQDALIRAHAGLRATDRPMALRPWLYMVVRNRALDALRAPRAASGELLDALDHPQLAAGSDPEQRAVAREELARIVHEIGRLPDRQRLALVRRELEGATHLELASALDTTIPGTKSLLHRARCNLGTALAA